MANTTAPRLGQTVLYALNKRTELPAVVVGQPLLTQPTTVSLYVYNSSKKQTWITKVKFSNLGEAKTWKFLN